MDNLGFLVLLDGEFRGLLRSSFEKVISKNVKKYDSDYKEILKKICIRCVSSLIAVQVYNYTQANYPEAKTLFSLFYVFSFAYIVYETYYKK